MSICFLLLCRRAGQQLRLRGGPLRGWLPWMRAGEALETALEAVQTLEAVKVLETSVEELWTSLEAMEELEMVGMQQCLRKHHHCLEHYDGREKQQLDFGWRRPYFVSTKNNEI